MIKDVHINSPKPFLKEIEFRADAAHSLRASEITDILEAVVAGKLGRLRSRAMLAIASFIIHCLDCQAELCALFQDLRPGAVALVVGATGDSYQRIYSGVDALALEAGLTEASWNTDTLARIGPEDEPAHLIKESQHRVYLYLEQLVGANALEKSSRWPDYWNAMPSPRAPALRFANISSWPLATAWEAAEP